MMNVYNDPTAKAYNVSKPNKNSNVTCTNGSFTNFVYSEKTNSYIAKNTPNKNNKIVGAAKFLVKKGITLAKRVIPGIFMMTAALTIGPMVRSCTAPVSQNAGSPAVAMDIAYKAGEQHIRDSIRIAELEHKLVADSIKAARSVDSSHLANVVKHIK